MIGSIRARSSNFTARYDLRKLPDPAQRGNFPHSAGVLRTLAEDYGGLKPSIDQTYRITVILP